MPVQFKEQYGSTEIQRVYATDGYSSLAVVKERRLADGAPSGGTLSQRFANFFRSVFLPQGYPESVSDDYVIYQVFDTIQAFASSITGTLATQAMMKGVGVGDEAATALAATMTWILKDGTGMVGRILFAWVQGGGLDTDSKRWRLFADLLNDLAICMEIAAQFFPMWVFTPIVCTAGVCKSIVGVAGGATRAALTQHQARRNNMADVSAKDGSQETVVNLSALICSLILVPIVDEKPMLVWLLFAVFTFVHIAANYMAVKSVVMESINLARLHFIVGGWLRRRNATPKEVNPLEPVVMPTKWPLGCAQFGVSVQCMTTVSTATTVEGCLKLFSSEQYLICIDTQNRCVGVVLKREAGPMDLLKAGFQVELMQHSLGGSDAIGQILSSAADIGDAHSGPVREIMNEVKTALTGGDNYRALEISYKYVSDHFDVFVDMLESNGWTTSHVLFGSDEWRAEWSKDL